MAINTQVLAGAIMMLPDVDMLDCLIDSPLLGLEVSLAMVC
jgi:hypothetical protein